MNLSDWSDIISTSAVFTTILQFLSGTLVCKQYVENKTTADASPLPFICGILASFLWLTYGLTKHDDKIVLVNIVGVVLMIAYTIVFYMMTFKKAAVLKQVLLVSFLIICVIIYTVSEDNITVLLDRIGFAACLLTIITIASPLSKLFHVFKVKNVECLPFPMILMSFVVSSLWFFYGMIIADTYLVIPNIIGAVLALSQLALFVIYPSTSESMLLKSVIA